MCSDHISPTLGQNSNSFAGTARIVPPNNLSVLARLGLFAERKELRSVDIPGTEDLDEGIYWRDFCASVLKTETIFLTVLSSIMDSKTSMLLSVSVHFFGCEI